VLLRPLASCVSHQSQGEPQPVNAIVYAGPYGIRGPVLSDQGDGILVQRKEWGLFPLRDAEIGNLFQGPDPPV
jgi:hypothetical protein